MEIQKNIFGDLEAYFWRIRGIFLENKKHTFGCIIVNLSWQVLVQLYTITKYEVYQIFFRTFNISYQVINLSWLQKQFIKFHVHRVTNTVSELFQCTQYVKTKPKKSSKSSLKSHPLWVTRLEDFKSENKAGFQAKLKEAYRFF